MTWRASNNETRSLNENTAAIGCLCFTGKGNLANMRHIPTALIVITSIKLERGEKLDVNGGNEWIENLIDRYYDAIYKYCYHMLRQRQDAEDASQEIFVKTLKSRKVQHQIQSEAAWIYRVAHNHCLNILKKRKLLQLLPFVPGRSSDSYQDAALAHVESSFDIDRMLSWLSAEERSIMVLRVIEGRAYEEIGAIINHSAAAARKKFERAKRKLQQSLQSGQGGHEHEQTIHSYI